MTTIVTDQNDSEQNDSDQIVRDCEVNFFEAMQNATVEPLSDDMTRMLLSVAMSEEGRSAEIFEKMSREVFQASVLKNRLSLFNRQVEAGAKLLLLMPCRTPGEIVMMASYVLYHAKKSNRDTVTLAYLCEEVFPMGFPTRDELSRLWDAQKGKAEYRAKGGYRVDNMLDTADVTGWLNE